MDRKELRSLLTSIKNTYKKEGLEKTLVKFNLEDDCCDNDCYVLTIKEGYTGTVTKKEFEQYQYAPVKKYSNEKIEFYVYLDTKYDEIYASVDVFVEYKENFSEMLTVDICKIEF